MQIAIGSIDRAITVMDDLMKDMIAINTICIIKETAFVALHKRSADFEPIGPDY